MRIFRRGLEARSRVSNRKCRFSASLVRLSPLYLPGIIYATQGCGRTRSVPKHLLCSRLRDAQATIAVLGQQSHLHSDSCAKSRKRARHKFGTFERCCFGVLGYHTSGLAGSGEIFVSLFRRWIGWDYHMIALATMVRRHQQASQVVAITADLPVYRGTEHPISILIELMIIHRLVHNIDRVL